MSTPNLNALKVLLPDAVLTLEEAAVLCGMTSAGIKKWHDKGKIKLNQIGSRYYVTGAELRRVVKIID